MTSYATPKRIQKRIHQSAGILLFRRSAAGLEVLLAHPGGPYYARKDEQYWSIPKGEFELEDPFEAAKREFNEETGGRVLGASMALTPRRQPSGKMVYAFAVEQDFDLASFRSNTFDLEWPPKSGRICPFPEVDKVAWFSADVAKTKLLPGQLPFLQELLQMLVIHGDEPRGP